MLTDKEAKEQIIQITNELFAMGLLTATGGNISAKSPDGETIWITPSQMYKGGLCEDDLVHIKADGTVLEGTRQPSVEYQMHAEAYRVRPGTTGAVHTHSPIATAFGICNQSFTVFVFTDVCADAEHALPGVFRGFLQLRRNLLELRAGACADRDTRAFADQPLRDGPANAASRARHDGALTFQIEHEIAAS